MKLITNLMFSAALLASAAPSAPPATEDGYDLWLRSRPLPAAQAAQLPSQARSIVARPCPRPRCWPPWRNCSAA